MATNTTNKTSKLGLSQYSANDYISFLTNYNSDMAAIDNSIGANNGIAGLNSNGKLAQMPTPSDIGAVPTSLTINSHALTSDLTLTPSDIGAATMAQGAKADSAVQSNQIGVANGVASLDAAGKVAQNPASLGQANGAALQLPSSTVQLLNGVTVAYGTPPRFAGCGKVGIFVATVTFPVDFTTSKTFALLPYACNRIEGSLMSETGVTRFLSLYDTDKKSLKVEGSISGVAGVTCHIYALLELI